MWRLRFPDWENLASQIFLAGVRTVVTCEGGAADETFAARVTLVQFLAGVRMVVTCEAGAGDETFAALVTLVRSVARVHEQVRRDGATHRETPLTDGTFERFFCCCAS